MRQWAEFDIQGNVAKIDAGDKVTRITIAANYSRKGDNDEWDNDPHFNRITFFGKSRERLTAWGVGDLVHVRGRVREGSYEKDGATVYTVDLIADEFARVAKKEHNAGGAD